MNSQRIVRRKQAMARLVQGDSPKEVLAFLQEKDCPPKMAREIMEELIPCPQKSLRCRVLLTTGILGCGIVLNAVIFAANGALEWTALFFTLSAPVFIWARYIVAFLSRKGLIQGPNGWQLEQDTSDTFSHYMV